MISTRRRWWRVIWLAFGVVPLFLSGLTIGLRVPIRSLLAPFSRSATLDYSAVPFRDFPSLRSSFVARALGDKASASAKVGATERAPALPLERLVVVHRLTNDDFSDAKRIPRVPYTAKTNTEAATRQNEPTDCTSEGGSVWYRYQSVRSEALIADTFGTSSATVLGVFSGTELSNLRSVGCANDLSGNAQLSVPAVAGTTYYFQVAGPDGGGRLIFNLTQQTTTRASVSSSGEEGRLESRYTGISSDGRFVSYSSRGLLDPNYDQPVSCLVGFFQDFTCPANTFVRDRLTHTTSLVSVSLSGGPANDQCGDSSISGNGRYVAFEGAATDLVSGDTNGTQDIFVRDLVLKSTRRISVSSSGVQSNGYSDFPQISSDGRYVAFTSFASNLVADDANGFKDVFVNDRLTGVTSRVSVASSGREANGEPSAVGGEAGSDVSSISADGRYVVFRSSASNLVSGDTNRLTDVFVRDRIAGVTTRVSVSSSEGQANGNSYQALYGAKSTVSRNGRYVAFGSNASNLVPSDHNGGDDVFVRDLILGVTERVSVSSAGREANAAERPGEPSPPTGRGGAWVYYGYSMTPDGRYVSFSSESTNLVPGDTNGLRDVFIHDRVTRTTTRVSLTDSGHEANGPSEHLVMSADGRFVAWMSLASNLVPGDTNRNYDVFVHEFPRAGRALSGWR